CWLYFNGGARVF
nr:immunoglobulin light chain junction region [Macaca mulatta]MPN86214.1 immunoglobulin light chain junction region [Macaca mulatta]